LQVFYRRGLTYIFKSCITEGSRDLSIQIPSIGHDDDGWIVESMFRCLELANDVSHRDGLSASLRMPHHATFIFFQFRNGLIGGAYLLIARKLLDHAPFLQFEDDVMTNDVQESFFFEK